MYLTSDTKASILGFKKDISLTDVTIPKTIDGKDVERVLKNAFYFQDIKKLHIPSTLKVIEQFAFSKNFIEDIIYEPGFNLTTILENNFSEYNKSTFYIPASVSFIGEQFFLPHNVVDIIVDDHNAHYKSIDGVLFEQSIIQLIFYPRGKNDEAYVVPSSVKVIRNGAFASSTVKDIIFLEDSLIAYFDSFSFAHTNFDVFYIPLSVTKINIYAFDGYWGIPGLDIIIEANEKPSGWHEMWFKTYTENVRLVWGESRLLS